ncbi:MAG: TonB-dependent receptor [Nitrospirae bacterium]|nr:TonB-dependent receptor [Nitrospirota bacterium]
MFRTLLFFSFLSSLLCMPVFSNASEIPSENPSVNDQLALNTTRAELLLFWAEKDLYVQTATRTTKPVSQVAENISVITAKDIEDMNAHSIAEALSRVTGLFIDFNGSDFNSGSLPHIQGSESRHVTVLLDGILWNALSGGEVDVFSIPVQIVERIEIIKGPASSAWGSALGGVINIITKNAGDTTLPKGMVSASDGEANSRDLRAELLGKGGPVAYYIYAGQQSSDGLRNKRNYSQDNLYAKLSAAPSRDIDMLFTVGYSKPFVNAGDVPEFNINATSKFSYFFVTGALDYRISPELSLKAAAYTFRQKDDATIDFLSPGTLLKESIWDEDTLGGSLKLLYTGGMHTAVFGAEISHGTMTQTINAGPLYQSIGLPASAMVSPGISKWALFTNDTIVFGKLAVTPGIRLDHDSISGSFVSPSIGATYNLGEHTVARASVARGFTTPGIGLTAGGGIFLVPNPNLTAESGWSYQTGLETGIADSVHVKATVFRHDTSNELVLDSTNRLAQTYRNGGHATRQGYEFEAETVPLYNISLKVGNAYVHKNDDSSPDPTVNYSYFLGLKYDNRKSFVAQLMGSYVWWDQPASQLAKYDTFIWDLALTKKIYTTEKTSAEVFLTVHNLFSGSYYTSNVEPNPQRWVNGGLRFKF